MTTMRAIAEGVAVKHRITLAEIRGPSKLARYAHPRQEAMSLCYATGKFSTRQIGRFFDRDHTTVGYACRAHAERAGA